MSKIKLQKVFSKEILQAAFKCELLYQEYEIQHIQKLNILQADSFEKE